jgi:DNA-binding NarL/FixJ family response regulator
MLPGLVTIVVTSSADRRARSELEAVGAIGFLQKHQELDVIEAGIGRLIDAAFPLESQLSERELQVLELVAEGRTNRDVARLLWLSDQTVKFHLANVYRKLGVGSRGEAVTRARAEGILQLEVIRRDGEDNEGLASAALV